MGRNLFLSTRMVLISALLFLSVVSLANENRVGSSHGSDKKENVSPEDPDFQQWKKERDKKYYFQPGTPYCLSCEQEEFLLDKKRSGGGRSAPESNEPLPKKYLECSPGGGIDQTGSMKDIPASRVIYARVRVTRNSEAPKSDAFADPCSAFAPGALPGCVQAAAKSNEALCDSSIQSWGLAADKEGSDAECAQVYVDETGRPLSLIEPSQWGPNCKIESRVFGSMLGKTGANAHRQYILFANGLSLPMPCLFKEATVYAMGVRTNGETSKHTFVLDEGKIIKTEGP